MADHAEDVGDTPVDHRLHKDVADGPYPLMERGKSHVDAVVPDLGGETRRAVREPLGRFAVEGVVVVSMPRAPEPALLDGSLTKRSTLMGTAVVEGAVGAVDVGQGKVASADCDRLDPTLGEIVEFGNLVPRSFGMQALGHGVETSRTPRPAIPRSDGLTP